MRRHLHFVLLCSMLSWMTSSCLDNYGQRFLSMEIYQEDQLVLESNFGVPDTSGPKAIWEYAGTPPFSIAEESLQIRADETNSLQSKLDGKIHIKIFHVKKLMTEAHLKTLTLKRKNAETIRWFLSEGDVKMAIEQIQN